MAQVVAVRNVTRGTTLAGVAQVADGFWSRLIGLLGRRELAQGTGLLLPGTPWIHTLGMAFPIDVVFYSRNGCVLRTVERLPAWRVSPIVWPAYAALELPAGTVQQSRTRAGDLLQIGSGCLRPLS